VIGRRSLGLCAIVLAGCATARQPCGDRRPCPEEQSCGLDGTCRPVGTPAARFARYVELPAIDWGWTRRDHPRSRSPDDDTLTIGGTARATLYLSFGPIPEDASVVDAILHLHVVDAPGTRARFRLEDTLPFHGGTLSFRSAPSVRRRLGRVQSTPRADQALLFEVRGARPDARPDGTSAIHLAVGAVGRDAPAVVVASPRHADTRLRPRLELVLQ